MNKIFFDSWESLLRVAIITIMAYIMLIFFLRGFGKRTLSKMNAFDLIVTIALGSTLATVILNKNVSLVEGLLAFLLLIFLQFVITFLAVRYRPINDMVKSTPSLMVYKGQMLPRMMKRERINEDEIYAFVRQRGLTSVKEVGAIVLETDGSLSLVDKIEDMKSEVLSRVKKSPQE